MADSPVAVLVVDGGSPQAEALCLALTAKGYVCSRASTAIEAIQLTMDTVFAAAIVENTLPGESGLAVVSHLRGDERPMPILLLVEGDDVGFRVEALRAGADDVVSSPADPAEVLARLARRLMLSTTITALQVERDALKALSTTDGLTQVANHRAFQERLKEEFRRAQRYDDPMALIVMDVDHFKAVNDTHGHQAGDAVLLEVAKAIRTAVRETDFIARYGGEEFAVLLPKTHLAGALTVAERMSQAIKAVRTGPGATIRVTASFGVSGFPGRGVTTAEQLFKTADDALFRSKREGRNKISLFQSSLYVARNG
ncbi:MAG: diguanylate cyclase [Myxococcales bacterium]|nr:diguanylate cyclase [Myxococcales bacterium]MDP3500238.1 diguanylate cyclase [Myxococcales bacterium]